MMTSNSKEQNFELLLENMIIIQGKLSEEIDRLSYQINQVEHTLQQTSQHEPNSMTFLSNQKDLHSENNETRTLCVE
jgi:hypothetical protein